MKNFFLLILFFNLLISCQSAKDALTLQKAATAGTTASGAIIGGVIAGPLWPVGAIVGGAVAYTGVVGGTVVYESLGSGTNGNESSVNVGNEEATALRLSPSTEALAALEQRELAAMEPRNVPVMSTQSSVDPRGSTIILTHYQADLISRLLRSSGLDNRDEYTSSLSRDNTGCCKSLVSRLWGLMRLFNIAGTVLGPRKVIGSDNEPDIVHRCMKILAARYLLCILIRKMLPKRFQFQKINYPTWGKILNGQIAIGLLQKEQMEGWQ